MKSKYRKCKRLLKGFKHYFTIMTNEKIELQLKRGYIDFAYEHCKQLSNFYYMWRRTKKLRGGKCRASRKHFKRGVLK